MKPFRTILVTTDFSDISTLAFPAAKLFAETFGAKVVVVYVQERLMPPFVGEYAQMNLQGFLDDQREKLVVELKRFADERIGSGIDVETVVGTGVPHSEIVRLAEERKVDLIVLATHGRGFLGHAVFGSTAERVVRRAPCPVLTVRPPD